MSPGQVLGGTTIQLGSVLLGVVDAQNVHWTIDPDGLQGWDSPEVRYSSTDREGDHGAWVGPTYLGPRPVTITGKIEAPDGPTLDAAKEALLAACSLTDTTLVVNESLSLQATVRRSGKPIITKITDSLASYSLLVTAADPRRYDVNLQTQSTALNSSSGGLTFPVTFPITFSATSVAGAITAANSGSMDTRPVFTVTGPATAPQIITRYPDGTTRTLSYSALAGGLAAGEQLVIDTDRHTVLSGGASRRRWISGDWPTIPANTTVLFQFRDTPYNAASLLTASWRSAWM